MPGHPYIGCMKLKSKIKFVPVDRTPFHQVLRARVDSYFNDNRISPHADAAMVIKSAVMIGLYLVPFVIILTMAPAFWPMLGLWAMMGIGVAGIGMGVMHDANHGAYSASGAVNLVMGHTLNLLGGSVHNWKLQHNILHHTYTNISGMDDDIADRLALRFSPHTRALPIHRLQRWYAVFFYGLLTLYWVVAKDIVQLIQFTGNGVNPNSESENWRFLLRIVALKVIVIGLVLGLPMAVAGYALWQVLAGFLLMHFVSGVILTVTFQLAHTVEGTAHPLPDDSGVIANDWAVHQVQTTTNFCRGNALLTWYVGGLNYQIEHHLFPKICHVHYPHIAPIVRQTCAEFGIGYHENASLSAAIGSHLRTLQRFGLPSADAVMG